MKLDARKSCCATAATLSCCATFGRSLASCQLSGQSFLFLLELSKFSELTPQKAKLGYPVHLQGVVTVSDRRPRLFYVQDETGGIYVELHGRKSEPLPGERVEIFGTPITWGVHPSFSMIGSKFLEKASSPKHCPSLQQNWFLENTRVVSLSSRVPWSLLVPTLMAMPLPFVLAISR